MYSICFINWLPNVGMEHYYTMVRLDRGHLHPLQEHPRQTCVGQESNPGRLLRRRALEERAIQTAYLFAIWNLHMAAPVHVTVTNGLIPGEKA